MFNVYLYSITYAWLILCIRGWYGQYGGVKVGVDQRLETRLLWTIVMCRRQGWCGQYAGDTFGVDHRLETRLVWTIVGDKVGVDSTLETSLV